ncbi:MAG TPA: sensor histidine kinase [Nitrospirae bacterium]|nr:sensor histidine kinase [Nitrospirota bacterium]
MIIKKIFNSIAFRISISIVVIVVATTIAVSWLILREQKRTLELELQSKGKYIAELISLRLIEPLLYEERYEMFSLLQASMKDKESLIVYAEIYNEDGETIITAYKDEKYREMLPPHSIEDLINHTEIDTPLIYHINVPMSVATFETIGFLRLGITKKFLYKKLNSIKRKLYLLSAGVIFIGIMLGLWMARKILKPILILNKGVKRVGAGELGVEVPVVGEGEIKELALSFNKMSVKLKELIDAIKAAQENLIRTEKLYAIGEFSAGVAHEIKTPLTSIKMLMQTVKHKRQALSSKDIEIIEGEINRIDRIVKEFLAFARPEKVEKTEVDINNLLEEVITITRPKMEQSAIYFIKRLSPSLPMIKGNHDALKQVFLNLVLNAMQAMDGWSGTLEIVTGYESGVMSRELSDISDSHKVIITIKDTGVGIPDKDLNRIFDPFFTTKEEGTGMGLALTHNIVKDHSGKIDVDSTPGKGTAVKVTLPCEQVA